MAKNTVVALALAVTALAGCVQSDTQAWDTTAGVEAAQWADNVDITILSDSWQYESDGVPSHSLPTWFLVPNDAQSQPFHDDDFEDFTVYKTADWYNEDPVSVMIPLRPTYVDDVQITNLGMIGVTITGARLFNDYENMELTNVALDDYIAFPVDENGDYDENGHDHAGFIDECNGHPLGNGNSYHYHGIPKCITDDIDVPGEHSSILGFLQDGFPVYANQGEGGVVVTNEDLDECSGHEGPTPEFPGGIYHYHLTADEAPYSIDCYRGAVSEDAAAGDMPDGPPDGGPPGDGPPGGGPPPNS